MIADHKDLNDTYQTFSLVEINVQKIDDATNTLLAGAEFALYDSDHNILNTQITDERGMARFLIPTGSYYIKETKAPQGYQIDRTKHILEVTGQEGNHELHLIFKNKKTPELPNTGVGASNTSAYLLLAGGTLLFIASFLRKKKEQTNETLED